MIYGTREGMNGSFDHVRPNRLEFEKVVGTSAKSRNQIATESRTIAYVVSGGVVVKDLDETNGTTNQRFFCANSNANESNDDYFGSVDESDKDQFGYTINDPMKILGNGMEKDSPNEGESKLKDRVKGINCVAISPNKQLLAVGEIGYQPRILIFSLAPDLSSNPIALIHEHSYGINSLVFSSDLKYLCSLGLVNDGFINIWKVTPASIQVCSSNKCSSVISHVVWHDSFIITMGLRMIKIWKFENGEKALKGKNVVLGDNLNCNFIDGDVLNNDELLLISDYNELLLLKLNYEDLKLVNLESPNFEFQSICVDDGLSKVWFGNKEDIESLSFDKLTPSTKNRTACPRRSIKMFNTSHTNSISFYKLDNLNSKSLLFLNESRKLVSFNKMGLCFDSDKYSLMKDLQNAKITKNNKLITFSKDGSIMEVTDGDLQCKFIFKFAGHFENGNELSAFDCTDKIYILGDKFGTLSIVNKSDNEIIYQTKAHSSTINDIIFFEQGGFDFIVSISRDRMIQFFYRLSKAEEWDILQTIPSHNGNVTKVKYDNGKVFACSSDRSLSVHKIHIEDQTVTITQDKLISIKATPVSFTIWGEDLLISTNDKTLVLYDLKTYELRKTIKLVDDRLLDSLLVESFIISAGLLIAACSDKSLRLYNYSTFKPLCMTWGHLETIIGLILKDKTLISISSDGCMFQWKLVNEPTSLTPKLAKLSFREDQSPIATKVTRKIIPTPTFSRAPVLKAESNEEVPQPRSPSPRLTNATLKRIEARRRSSSPTAPTVAPPSASKPRLSPTKPLSIPNLPRTKNDYRPLLPVSPFKNDHRAPMLPESPTRPRVILEELGKRVVKDNFETSLGIRPPLELGNIGETSGNKSSIFTLLDMASTILRAELETLSIQDRKILISKLGKMKNLLSQDEDETSAQTELLETYSNNLIKLFEMKLNQQHDP